MLNAFKSHSYLLCLGAILSLTILSACGQKGPLVLPEHSEKTPSVNTAPENNKPQPSQKPTS